MRQQSQEISAVVVAGNVNIAFEPDTLTGRKETLFSFCN